MLSRNYREMLEADTQTRSLRRRPMRLTAIFLAVFFILQYAWESSRGTWLEHAIIDQATVIPAAWFINQLWPEGSVTPTGHRLIAPLGRLNILNGCEGLETLFLLAAAFIAYPFVWRKRWLGLGLGTLLVFALNQARIVILWHAFLNDRDLFSTLHGTVLPLLMIACCFSFFIFFMARYDAEPT